MQVRCRCAGAPGPRPPHMTSCHVVLFQVKLAPERVRPHFPQTEKQGFLLSSCAAPKVIGPREESEDGSTWRCQKLGDSPVRAVPGAPGGHRTGAAGALRQAWTGRKSSGASCTHSAPPRPDPGRAVTPCCNPESRGRCIPRLGQAEGSGQQEAARDSEMVCFSYLLLLNWSH